MQETIIEGLLLCLLALEDTKMLSKYSWTIPKELNWMQEVRNNGYTAFTWACQYGCRDVVKLLLEATEVDITYPMQ